MSLNGPPTNKRLKLEEMDLSDICSAVVDDSGYPMSRTNSDYNGSLLLDFPGPCDFGYSIRNEGSTSGQWSHSETLSQVFIRVGNVLKVVFKLDVSKAPSPKLFVRTTPVFCSADYMHVPVERCTLHALEDDPRGEAHHGGVCRCNEFNLVGHVVRANSSYAVYCFDPSSGRHSVLIPIRHRAYDQFFHFTCKSSCSRGMERRPIRLVFSLEDESGLVLGRCSLNIKICSCPKRDMDRAERELRFGVLKKKTGRPNNESRLSPSQSQMSVFSDLVDPLAERVETLEHFAA